MVVLVFGNVVLRYAFNSGITVSEELSRWLFVWLTFVGAVVALRDHAHLGMDSVVSRLPAWGKKVCFIVEQRADALLRLPVLHRQLGSRRSSTSTTWRPRPGCRPGWFYYSVGIFFSRHGRGAAVAQPLAGRVRAS